MWYLYILQCGDGSLYTGITTDVEKRLEAHRSGKGAREIHPGKVTAGTEIPGRLRHPLRRPEAGIGDQAPFQRGKAGTDRGNGIMITPCGLLRAFKSLNSPQGVLRFVCIRNFRRR